MLPTERYEDAIIFASVKAVQYSYRIEFNEVYVLNKTPKPELPRITGITIVIPEMNICIMLYCVHVILILD